jgi:homoserine O-succinyltransferase/O-acetyltransferase
MPLLIEPKHSHSAGETREHRGVTIGLVNNMPDAAVEATERQFAALIGAASAGVGIRLRLFAMQEVPRPPRVRARLAGRYCDISELWDAHLDALIVTGTEPRAAALADEPYWPAFRQLVAWARDNTISTLWSCLAAHAAAFDADGIERQPLPDKLFGVFNCGAVAEHSLTRELQPPFAVPHSRYNDLPEGALIESGYDILTRSAATGADAFLREEKGRSLFVFFQGHPEYETDTLAREYRRDIGRFLRGERDRFPAAPQNYFKGEAAALVDAFRARAIRNPRESLIADFPMQDLEANLENTWRHFSVGFYRNWISYLKERKAAPRTLFAPRDSRRNAAAADGRRPATERSVVR